MNRKFSLFALIVAIVTCLTFGLVACSGEEGDDGRVNPRIVLETDESEVALDMFDTMEWQAPYAGVYYENLDRVDGVEVTASLKDSTGGYVYENELDYVNRIMIPSFIGKYELIYSAEGCADAVITIYVCERLVMGADFTLENGTLTWEEVFGASGYEVTVNGKNPVFTETASFTSDIFEEEGFYVGVTAKGDNKEWIDSYMSSYENRTALKDGELAAFDNPCYELDVEPAIPGNLNAPPEQIEYLTEEECEGSTGGALRMLLKSGEYGPALFRLYLETKIDKNEDFDGMEIRFKLDSSSYLYSDENDTTRFILAQPSADERRVGRGTYVYEGHNDSWQVVKIPKSAVEGFDTLNYLQFSLYNMTRSGGKGYLYLDYIRLYKDEIATPTNVAINEDKLDWDDVENAASYVISVDKTDDANDYLHRSLFMSKTSEISLSAIGIDTTLATQQYEIQVMAVSEDTTIGSSVWSTKLTKRAELAEKDVSPLDNAIYAMDVDNVFSHSHMYWKGYEMATGAEGGNAILATLNADGTYGKVSLFTVNLPKPLNLEANYDCIILRFQVTATNYTSLDTLGIQLVGKSQQNVGAGKTEFRQAITVGEWIEYQMSMEDLKTYYATGDTKLIFQIANPVENKSGGAVYLKIALDYLRYYNTIDVPQNVRIDGTMLKWDAVEGASSYTVNVNGVAYGGITETSYDISSFTGTNTFKVLANSANSEYASSVYSAAAYYEVLEGDCLASFNHGGYGDQVVAGNPNIAGNTLNAAVNEKNFDASIGNEGALILRLRAEKAVSGGKQHIFTVSLAEGLDLTNRKAIQITFCVSRWSKSADGTPATLAKFMVLHATAQDESYTAGTVAVSAEVVVDKNYTNFQTLRLTVEQLKALGYTDGMKYLTFSVWTNKDTLPNEGGTLYIAMDDISYCQMLATPTNARIEGNLFKWDAVEGVGSYGVDIDGVETTVTETSMDLSSYASVGAVKVKVRAIPADGSDWDPSEYTATMFKFFLEEGEVASFNHEKYAEIITPAQGNRYYVGSPSGEWKASPMYSEGTVTFRLLKDYYGTGSFPNTRLAAFVVALPEALDLTKAGIKVRMYVQNNSGVGTSDPMTVSILHNSGINSWNTKPTNPNVKTDGAAWVEFLVTSKQLTKLGYAAGEKTLTFGVYTETPTDNFGPNVTVIMDYIVYGEASEFPPEPTLADGLDENELANFNEEGYVDEIGCIAGETFSAFKEAPVFEKAGTSAGTVTFTVYNDDYRDPHADWTNIAPFKVTLPKALNLESGYAGIKAKIYVGKAADVGKIGFELLDGSKSTTWNATKSSASITIGADGVMNTGWLELVVSNEQLAALGYKTGDTVLTFGLRAAANASAKHTAKHWTVSMDYIEYATEEDFPKADDNALVDFNSSADTAKVVSGNEHATNGGGTKLYGAFDVNEVDTTKGEGGALHLKVRGDVSSWRSSGYSHIVTINLPKGLDLTNNEGIEIKFCVSGWSGSTTTVAKFMVLHATLIDKDYRSGEAKAGYVEVVKDETATNFQTLRITAEQLKSIGYEDGVNYITVSVWTDGDTIPGQGGRLHLWLDDISYYKSEE